MPAFNRGQEVSVDERDGNLWCVAARGDLDAIWTIDKVIDLNPPLTSGGGASGQSGGKRGALALEANARISYSI